MTTDAQNLLARLRGLTSVDGVTMTQSRIFFSIFTILLCAQDQLQRSAITATEAAIASQESKGKHATDAIVPSSTSLPPAASEYRPTSM